ncbi:hypothetical protein NOM01_10980 [Sporolactobacillus sp. STSJ-5]|uniref:hypothetical protein n=1 Tax=Sporolactobacillus sp. STSJ-5 TaxID=2965076 RepID=UPI0021057625|nr:hypothetical protein [Sporolactobacillus sp. STSJ-5]MCQ2010539.1 hypothetical protein [Sporolactobacillus sp. STSJ-5]
MTDIRQIKDPDGTTWYPQTHAEAVVGLDKKLDKTYEYSQLTPSDTWNITHNLGKMPSVAIVDSSGTQVIGEVQYTDLNNLTVSFSAAFAGKAYLN